MRQEIPACLRQAPTASPAGPAPTTIVGSEAGADRPSPRLFDVGTSPLFTTVEIVLRLNPLSPDAPRPPPRRGRVWRPAEGGVTWRSGQRRGSAGTRRVVRQGPNCRGAPGECRT